MRACFLALVALLLGGRPSTGQESPPEPVPVPEPVAVEVRPFFFALSVADVEASEFWYERVFGFSTVRSIDVEARGLRIRLLARQGAFLELSEVSDARALADMAPDLEKRYLLHGVFKVGFEVEHLDRALARLETLEVDLRGMVITETDGSMRSAQVEDPDGNVIQLFEILE